MGFVYLNGEWLHKDSAGLPLDDRGVLLGDGVFDTLKYTPDGGILFAEDHITRLLSHAATLQITSPQSKDEIIALIHDLISKNNWNDQTISIRTTITRGSGQRGIAPPIDATPALFITGNLFDDSALPDSLSLRIAQTVKRNEGSPLSQIKSLNYGDGILAKIEATAHGYNDCILLNNLGDVTCTSAGNIIVLKDNVLMTPPLSSGVMDGIMRGRLIKSHGIRESVMTKDMLLSADHVYVTNSLTGVIPVSKIDETSFDVRKF